MLPVKRRDAAEKFKEAYSTEVFIGQALPPFYPSAERPRKIRVFWGAIPIALKPKDDFFDVC